MPSRKTGVIAEFDTKAFSAGLKIYIDGLLQAETAAKRVAASINAAIASIKPIPTPQIAAPQTNIGGIAEQLNKLQNNDSAKVVKDIAKAVAAMGSAEFATGITNLNSLTNTLAKLGKVPDLTNIASSVKEFVKGTALLSKVPAIPQAVLDSIRALITLIGSFTNVSDLRGVANVVKNIAAALKTFNKFPSIQQSTISSLEDLGKTLQRISVLFGGNLVQQFQNVVKAIQTLTKLPAQVAAVPLIPLAGFQNLAVLVSIINKIPPISNITPTIKSLQSLIRTLGNIKAMPTLPANFASTILHLASSLRTLQGVTNTQASASGLSSLLKAVSKLSSVQPVPPAVVASVKALLTTVTSIAANAPANLASLASVLTSLAPLLRNYAGAANTASTATISFGNAIKFGLGAEIGRQAIQSILALKNAITSLFADTFRISQFFENFKLSLETVVSSELRAADATLTMAESLENSKALVFGYSEALTDLAIKSKFTTAEVSETFQVLLQGSFTMAQALRITDALVDKGSGSGLTADRLNSIAKAMADVQTKTKLTGEEVRQFGNQFIPIVKLLAEKLGKTNAQITQDITDGAISADVAITTIMEHLEEVFAGAAERTQGTLTGVVSSLQDIAQLAKASLFENMFAPVLPLLQEMVEIFTSSEFRAGLVVFGQIIGTKIAGAIQFLRGAIAGLIAQFNALSPETKQMIVVFGLAAVATFAVIAAISALVLIIGALINPFTVLIGIVATLVTAWTFGFDKIQEVTVSALGNVVRSFGIVSEEAVTWGINIMNSLADGIQGAVGLILDALSVVASAISYLLSPGSPPRLLPDLDKWGTGAAAAYLEGWTKVQFDKLHEFGALVETEISNLFESGKITKLQAIQFKIDVRQPIAEAIEQIRQFGVAAQETISDIARISGLGLDVVEQYVTKYAAVAAATKLAADAQKVLTAATQTVTDAQNDLNKQLAAFDAQLKPLQDKLAAINKVGSDADRKIQLERLQRVIDNNATSEAQKAKAQAEIDKLNLEAQIEGIEAERAAAEDAGQTRLTAAQELERQAQAQFAAQQALVDKAQEQLDLFLLQVKESQASVDLQIEMKNVLAEIAAQLAKVAASMDGIGDKIKKALDPLQQQLRAVQLQQEELQDLIELKRQQAILEDVNATAAEKTAAQLKIQEIQIKRNIRAAEAKELGIDLSGLAQIPIVFDDIAKKGGKAKDALDEFKDSFEAGDSGLGLTEKLEDFNKKVEEVRLQFEGFGKSFDETIAKIDAQLPSFLKLKSVTGETAPIIKALGFAVGFLAANLALKAFVTSLPGIRLAFVALSFVVRSLVMPALGLLATALGAAGPLIVGLALVGGAIYLTYVAFRDNWWGIREKTLAGVNFVVAQVKRLNEQQWFIATDKWLIQYRENLKTWLDSLGVGDTLRNIQTSMAKIGAMIYDALIEGLVTKLREALPEGAKGAFDAFMILIRAYLGLGEGLGTGVSKAGMIGVDVGDGIVQGITESKLGSPTLDIGLATTFGILVKQIKTFFGIGSPSTLMRDEVGTPIAEGVVQGIIDKFNLSVQSIIDAFKLMIDGVFTADILTYVGDKAKAIGQGIIDGVKAAFADPGGTVKGAFTGLIDSIFGAGKDEAESHSPSKRSEREIGKPIAEGINEGLKNALSLSTFTLLIGNIILGFVGLVTSVLGSVALLVLSSVLSFTGLKTTIVQLVTDMNTLSVEQVTLQTDNTITLVTTLKESVVQLFTDANLLSVAQVTLQSVNTIATFVALSIALLSGSGVVVLLTNAVVKLFADMSDAIVRIIQDLEQAIIAAFNSIAAAVAKFSYDFGTNVGKRFGDGFVDGLLSKLKAIREAAETVVNAATKSAKEAAGIESPSKKARKEIGTPFAEGISQGILKSVKGVQTSVLGLMTGAFNMADRVQSRLGNGQSVSNTTNARTNIYNLTAPTNQSPQDIRRSFAVMEVFAG